MCRQQYAAISVFLLNNIKTLGASDAIYFKLKDPTTLERLTINLHLLHIFIYILFAVILHTSKYTYNNLINDKINKNQKQIYIFINFIR